jgi:hypothetical protein
MKRNLLILVLLMGALFCLTSCTTAERTEKTLTGNQGQLVYSSETFTVVKFYDAEQHATVYLMDGYQSGGIFVLPDNP